MWKVMRCGTVRKHLITVGDAFMETTEKLKKPQTLKTKIKKETPL